MSVSIRCATSEDCPLILKFIKDLAAFEKAPGEVVNSVEGLRADGFSDSPLFYSYILEWENEPCGFFLYYFSYSTWKGKALYLEDLYIDPNFRGKGIGKVAMTFLKELAQKEKCKRFHWQALDWNEPAISFYKSFGAEIDPEWVNCRMHFT